MNTNTHKEIVKRFYKDVWDDGKLDLIDEFFEPHYIVHDLPSWRKPGANGLKEFIADNHRMFPDVQHTIIDIIAEGDKVAVSFTATGTHKAELNGPVGVIPATNKKVHWDGMSIFIFRNGKISEAWGVVNNFDLMKQLGGIPERT